METQKLKNSKTSPMLPDLINGGFRPDDRVFPLEPELKSPQPPEHSKTLRLTITENGIGIIHKQQLDYAIHKSNISIIQKVQTKINEHHLSQRTAEFINSTPEWRSMLEQYYEILDKEESNSKSNKKTSSRTKALWVTISLPEDQPFEVLQQLTRSMVSMINFEKHMYNFECRSHNPPAGFHSHILIWRNSSIVPSRMITQLKSKYEHWFGEKPTPHALKIVSINTEDHMYNVVQYLQGTKIGADKMAKVELDREWRAKNNIDQLYVQWDEEEEEEESE